jgi:hypothetical protein
MHNVRRIEGERCAVILAGGNASKLMPLTRRITGRPIELAYEDLPCRDFAADVLPQNAPDLALVPVEGLYRNDLSDPRIQIWAAQ